MTSMRDAYGEALVALGEENRNVVVLDADVAKSTRSALFGERFPQRFFDVGIAEANMMNIAAGMAACGLIPFVNSFSFLLTLRAGEQLRTSIAYPRLNVKVAGAYAGLSDSFDGATHQDPMDLAVTRAMPNMTVVCFSDAQQVRNALPVIAAHQGPVYMRLHRNEVPSVSSACDRFVLGKAVEHRDGHDVAIIGTGIMVHKTLEAAEKLEKMGIASKVLEIHTLKPIDAEAIVAVAQKTGAVVTAEEHSVIGGLGSAVSEILGAELPVPIERVGIADTFAESGAYESLLAKYGLTADAIVAAAHRAIRRRDASLART